MLQEKSILFLGDSYTWGEALELYSDDPKWVKERSIDNNQWLILQPKQDDEAYRFRNENRFAGLVGKHFNCNVYVDDENGGRIARNLLILEKNLIEHKVTDVVLQFTSFKRESHHLSFDCRCDFCMETQWAPILDNLLEFIFKHEHNRTDEITFEEKEVFKLVSTAINDTNFLSLDFLEKADNFCKNYYSNQIEYLREGMLQRIENNHNIRFHYIDSWCEDTSFLLHRNFDLKNNFIPLIGKNNRKYKKWNDWLQTFENKNIVDDFPECGNHHPTLEMHQYIAKSIISHFDNFL